MLSSSASLWRVSLLLIANCWTAHAATPGCASLKRAMDRSHISNVAVTVFAQGRVRSIFCTSSSQDLPSGALFEAASLSKPVFALGVLILVQEGRLDLDRPLAQYLNHPYEHQQDPFGQGTTDAVFDPRFAKITARMVLSHTSGLPNWSHHGSLSLQSMPGERWSYSGEGYVYLQKIVEAITRKPIDVFLQEDVLLPLGMTHSSFVWQPDFENVALPGHLATGVLQGMEKYSKPIVASTLYTTLGDYSRFVSQMLHPTNHLPFAVEEERQKTVRPELHLAWGLGVAIEDTRLPSYFHWGANPGFQSFFMCQPKTGRGVLFFTDSDSGLDLVDTLVHESIPGPHPVLQFPMLHPKD